MTRIAFPTSDTVIWPYLLIVVVQKMEKKIPNQPENIVPVQLRPKQIFTDVRIGPGDGKPFVAGRDNEAKQ